MLTRLEYHFYFLSNPQNDLFILMQFSGKIGDENMLVLSAEVAPFTCLGNHGSFTDSHYSLKSLLVKGQSGVALRIEFKGSIDCR